MTPKYDKFLQGSYLWISYTFV